ncbi:MAG TPA: peptidoglycan DD-metalloendopeptidase family protein [Desulfuromonadales bacterium]|jgi:lipoprotein NlpD
MTVRILVLLFLLLLPGACSSPRGVYHTVHEGQTLYRIGRIYGVDERYLARINRIDDPSQLRVGTRIYIPGADRVREVPVLPQPSTPAAPALKTPATVKGASPSPMPAARQQGKTSAVNKPKPAAVPAPVVKGKFGWPLKGTLLKEFGVAGGSPVKGVEISAEPGTPVLSAAAGRVIYSGDGIRTYGNLIILRHDNDFFTVYGFNQKNIVDAGTFVSKGERIALSGAPPAGGKPRLYFEIRRGKEPVNPIFYLP